MKILVVGGWQQAMYEQAFSDALLKHGHQTLGLAWGPEFSSTLGRAETKLGLPGPVTRRFNRKLVAFVESATPDVVLVWRGTNILPQTLRALKATGVQHLASYNHDDFTGPTDGAPVPWHHRRLWKTFLECAPIYDSHFVKRQSNVEHLRRIGSSRNFIMPMWFVPDLHRPIDLTTCERDRYEADVVFAGHFERDGREGGIRALMEAGLDVKLWGGDYWNREVLGDLYDRLAPIVPALGDEYAKALCGAKVCLCFLSALNRDTYTRRCFEIPACGRVMLAQRTDDLLRLFEEDVEACFFSSTDELVRKAKWLVDNPEVRERIAEAGLRRVWADGHDVVSRAESFLDAVRESAPVLRDS